MLLLGCARPEVLHIRHKLLVNHTCLVRLVSLITATVVGRIVTQTVQRPIRVAKADRASHQLQFDPFLFPVTVLQHEVAHALESLVLDLEVLLLLLNKVVLHYGYTGSQHWLQLSLPSIHVGRGRQCLDTAVGCGHKA